MYVLDRRIPKYQYKIRDELLNLYLQYLSDNEIKITKNKEEKIRAVVSCFVFNGVKALCFNQSKIRVPLRKSVYSKPLIYNGRKVDRGISYTRQLGLLDWMELVGFIELEVGGVLSYTVGEGTLVADEKKPSYIVLGNELISMLEPYARKSKLWVEPNVLIIRDKKGNDVQYKLTDELREIVSKLNQYNEIFRDHNIEIQGGNLLDVQGKKIYNNSTINDGGRTYMVGGLVQGDNKEIRKTIKIDGEAVVEYDYHALHPSICATLNGVELDKEFDPYTIEMPDIYDKKTLRSICKLALLIMINANNVVAAKIALNKEMFKSDKVDLKNKREAGLLPEVIDVNLIMEKLVERNSYMANFFFSGEGIRLQNIDSRIMDYVIDYFTQRDEVVIPIHDSAIVRESLESELERVMYNAYEYVLGNRSNCFVESAW